MPRDQLLFSEGDLYSTLDAQSSAAGKSVEEIPREQFLATTVDTLVEHLCSKFAIEPLVIYEDKMTMDHKETRVEVTGRFDYDFGDGGRVFTPGHELVFYLPFTGDPQLWRMRPSTWSSMPPRGEVDSRQSVLVIRLTNTGNTEADRFKQELQSQLSGIRQLIQSQSAMLSKYHSELPGRIAGSR
jgi:hypothetical protein